MDGNSDNVSHDLEASPAGRRMPTGEAMTPADTQSSIGDVPLKTSAVDNEDCDSDAEAHTWLAHYEKEPCKLSTIIPPIAWFPVYLRTALGRATASDTKSVGGLPYAVKADMIAGLTVGFMLVPQSLAFALLAGLPVQIGLYASFAPLVVYALLGTIRQVQPGPTALMSLLTAQALDAMGMLDDDERVKGAALLSLLVGTISLLLGALRFGFIVDFMSHSVMAAFCSAAGVTIGTSQLKHLLGINMPRQTYWWQTAMYLATHILETEPWTLLMSGTLLVLLLGGKQWKSAGSAKKRQSHCVWRWLPTRKESLPFKVLKLIADLSSLLAVIVGWFWALAYRQAGIDSVRLVGEVEGGGLRFITPNFAGANFGSCLLPASIMAVVGFLETLAVGGKFASQARYDYNPNQELLALGLSNVAGGLMSGYPTTGSFSRTAVNAMLGATSLIACALTSVVVFMAIYILLPAIALLPLGSLAPIIIQGAIGVVSIHDFALAWGSSRAEFVVMASTFAVSLALTVKEGLLVGFVLSVLKTMHDLANPNLAVCGRLGDNSFRDIRNFTQAELIPEAVVVRMDARINFANSRKMKEFCLKAVQVREARGENIKFLIVDGKSINHVDLTGCEMLEVLAETLHARGTHLILANLKGPVSKYLAAAGITKALAKHGGHLSLDMQQAIAIINGADPMPASKMVEELAKRVDATKVILSGSTGGAICKTRSNPCYSGDSTAKSTRPAKPSDASEVAGPRSRSQTALSMYAESLEK